MVSMVVSIFAWALFNFFRLEHTGLVIVASHVVLYTTFVRIYRHLKIIDQWVISRTVVTKILFWIGFIVSFGVALLFAIIVIGKPSLEIQLAVSVTVGFCVSVTISARAIIGSRRRTQ